MQMEKFHIRCLLEINSRAPYQPMLNLNFHLNVLIY